MDEKTIARFWAKVDKRGPDECWGWLGALFGDYPRFGQRRASHFAFEVAFGVRPIRGLVVMHKCDNPPCVNPAHLVLGTQCDNMRDKADKGRSARNTGPCVAKRHRQLPSGAAFAIRERAANGETFRAIADDYGIHYTQASRIARGISGNKRVLSEAEISDIRGRLASGEHQSSIAVHHGVTVSHIKNIRNGHRGGPTQPSAQPA
jgi:hypothetical protein